MFEAMQQPFESPDQCHQSGLDASPNVVGDAPLTIPGREERVPHEKNINLVRNCKNNSENMLLGNANTAGEIRKAASDCRGAANVSDQGLLDESEDIDQKNVIVRHSIANPDSQLPESAEKKVKTTPSLQIILGTGTTLTKEKLELRKDRKRQSNRESAKRSRMRKQEEIKILQTHIQEVKAQSTMLKDKLLSLSEECEKLTYENKSLMVELKQMDKPDAFLQFLHLQNGEIDISKLIPSLENSTPHQS